VEAYDADVLILAGIPDHPLGRRVAALFFTEPAKETILRAGVGSALLLPEVLSKPLKDENAAAVTTLSDLLIRLDLRPVDQAIAVRASVLGAKYKLCAADATHLATAVSMGAQRFITNDSKDFDASITEIDVTYPADLPDPVS
jgi:predicted nucleic acid-binding protein